MDESLDARIDRLEKALRRLTHVIGVLFVLLLAAAVPTLYGLTTMNESEFSVTAPDGQAEAHLSTVASGAASIGVSSRTEGSRRASLAIFEDGRQVLRFLDRDQRMRAELGLGPAGDPFFVMANKNHLPRLAFALRGEDQDRAELRFSDGENRTRMLLSVDEDGSPSLVMFDEEGQVVYQVP